MGMSLNAYTQRVGGPLRPRRSPFHTLLSKRALVSHSPDTPEHYLRPPDLSVSRGQNMYASAERTTMGRTLWAHILAMHSEHVATLGTHSAHTLFRSPSCRSFFRGFSSSLRVGATQRRMRGSRSNRERDV